MNILHVVQLYYPVASGAARYFAEIGERLAAEGHQVTVLASDGYDLEHFWASGKRTVPQAEEWHNGVKIVRLPVKRLPGPPIVYPILRRAMLELSRVPGSTPLLRRMAQITPQLAGMQDWLAANGPFDLVHTTNITLDFAIFPAFAAAQRWGVPFICTPFVHLGVSGDPTIVRYYSMRHQIDLLRHSDQVITMTGLERDFLIQRGVPAAQITRVGVGITPAEAQGGDGAAFRTTQQISGPLVLYIGTLAYDKGAIHTVEAMQRLWAQGSDATLALIGAPLEQFTRFYEALPAATKAHIRLLPYASDQTKRDALAAADLFCMPSRTDSFGITYLEAWCNRLPVIGARAGGVPDVVSDQVDGLLVDFGNIDQLAATITQLLTDRPRAQAMGQAGYDKVQHELTWERIYQRARAVYDEALVVQARPTATTAERPTH